ncbi:MAG: cyclic nucleotide-binding domain-containing protein [Anaerolineae bacterium]
MVSFPFFDDSDATVADFEKELILLPEWGSSNWNKLLEITQTQMYSSGDVVVRAGSTERCLYIVAFGTLTLLINRKKRLLDGLNRTHKSALITSITSGSVINEQTFLDGKPSPATIQAVTECQLLYLNADSFAQFTVRHPELACAILSDLGRLLSLQIRRMASLLAYYSE